MHTVTGGLCLILLILRVNMLSIFERDDNTFGPYTINWTGYELCKGPKSNNVTVLSTKLSKEGNFTFGYFNFTFLTETKFEEIKIVVYSLKGNHKNLLWTYKITDPCNHFLFSSLINTFYNTKNCMSKKGPLSFTLNFNELTDIFLGTSFFYGEFLLKATATSKQGNIACLTMMMKFTKKAEII